MVFLLNGCAIITDDDQGIILYENDESIFLKEIFEVDKVKMQNKRSSKIIIQPNSNPPELRFKKRAFAHCKQFGRTAEIQSIQPRLEINGETITKYNEKYYCKQTS